MRFVAVTLAVALASCGLSASDRLQSEAEDAVRRLLRDPESARFSEVRAFPDRNVVCGKVNARNGFGGYVGDELFAYRPGEGAVIISGDADRFQRLHGECLAGIEASTEAMRAETNRIQQGMAEAEAAKNGN